MAGRAVDALDAGLDDFVAAYEAELARHGHADLADFVPPRAHALYLPVLQELVRVELDCTWRRGRPHRLEEYQRRFPELFKDRESLEGIAFEEYRLRRQLGDRPSAAEYRQRWGVNVERWPGSQADVPTAVVAAGNPAGTSVNVAPARPAALLSEAPADAVFPAVGADLLDFHLLAELGRGAFGRVYMARQKGLAGRPVVLKVSTNVAVETRMLAQLQHTNIIPVYSVHAAGPLQAVCMPYLGSATLADFLRDVRGRGALPQSGKGLVDTAQACASTVRQSIIHSGVLVPDREPGGPPEPAPVAWKQLGGLTYVQAVLWLAARLADGLAHAHERGILHRDLKPANILLSDDGQPMLLDFNLSEDMKLRTSPAAAFVGGTLPYMAPEHLQAFRLGSGAIDARSDVHSLGVILYELLTARHPFPTRTGAMDAVLAAMIQDRHGLPPRLRRWNRAVSPAVESIVRHCLEPDPRRRYQSARELYEDLQCQLEHRPLRHAAEPSPCERAVKCVRRHPRLAVAGGALLALTVIAGLVTALAFHNHEKARWAAEALAQEFRDDAAEARLLLGNSQTTDRERWEEGKSRAWKALALYRVPEDPAWWEAPVVRRLAPPEQQQLRQETSELLLLLASMTARQAQAGEAANRAETLHAALDLNGLAARSCPGDWAAAVERQRAQLMRMLAPAAAKDQPGFAFATDSQPSRDVGLQAQEWMDQGRYRDALPLWRQATRRDPRDLWAWAGLAACYEHLARYTDAAACYGTCVALAPRLPGLYFRRGMTHLRAKDYAEARDDFDHFLAKRPADAGGYINRALAWDGLGKNDAALQDITRAIELGTPQTRVYFIRALFRAKAGDRDGARQDRAKGLQLEPKDERSCVVRGLHRLSTEPKAALADFDRALGFNPRSLDALQNKASVLSEQLGQVAAAVAVLHKAVELYPEYVPARAGRGVLLARLGKRKEAIQDAEECLRRDVRPATLYQVAGIYALTSKERPGDREEAFFLLSSALRKGYGANLLKIDTDLDPIRDLPEFRRLTARARAPAATE